MSREKLPVGRPKQSFWCWKVGMVLLYGQLECIDRIAPGVLHVATGELARHLRVSNLRCRQYLNELVALGVISDLTLRYGSAIIRINAPVGYEPAGVLTLSPGEITLG